MTGFWSYLLRRVVASVIAVFGVATIIFLMVRLLPGDPARVIAGLLASEEDVQQIRVQLGFDRPLYAQYGIFLARLGHGDLGSSARTSAPVLQEIGERLPATLKLAVVSSIIATVLGVAAGVVAAARSYSTFDYLLSVVTLFGVSMPVYWLGLVLIILFAIDLNWLPAAGADQPGAIILPSITLAAFSVAIVARMTRSSMLEVLGQDYVRTARAKGLGGASVIVRHALRNALIPVVTVFGLQFGNLLAGAVIVETVFSRPGLGRLIVGGILAKDFPLVQGTVLFVAASYVLINVVVDVAYAYVDPRIRIG